MTGVHLFTLSAGGARRLMLGAAISAVLFAAASAPALAEVGFGSLYLNGAIVGTVVTPAEVAPGSGRDPFYHVTNGVAGQLGIAGVGPGEPGYHGGDWEFFSVTFKSGKAPYLLTSGSAVLAAEAKGDVTVTRVPTHDFRCPVTNS